MGLYLSGVTGSRSPEPILVEPSSQCINVKEGGQLLTGGHMIEGKGHPAPTSKGRSIT